jgi:hypothetical protein
MVPPARNRPPVTKSQPAAAVGQTIRPSLPLSDLRPYRWCRPPPASGSGRRKAPIIRPKNWSGVAFGQTVPLNRSSVNGLFSGDKKKCRHSHMLWLSPDSAPRGVAGVRLKGLPTGATHRRRSDGCPRRHRWPAAETTRSINEHDWHSSEYVGWWINPGHEPRCRTAAALQAMLAHFDAPADTEFSVIDIGGLPTNDQAFLAGR